MKKNSIIKLFTMLLAAVFFHQGQAQDTKPELSSEQVEHIDYTPLEAIQLLQGAFKPRAREKNWIEKQGPTYFEQIVDSPLKKVFLPQAAIIIDFKNNQAYTLPRDIFTLVHTHIHQSDQQHFFILRDKEGQLQYAVAQHWVSPVEQVTDLKVKPTSFKTWPKRKTLEDIYDNTLDLLTEFTAHFDQYESSYAQRLSGEANAQQSTTPAWELALFTDWDIPLNIGLNLSYKKAQLGSTPGGHTLTWFMAGPSLRLHLDDYNDWRLYLTSGAQKSFLYRYDDQSTGYSLSATHFHLGLESKRFTEWGIFTLGSRFLKQNIAYKNQVRPGAQGSFSAQGFSLYLGYGLGVDL